ncbi:MAG: glycosyltransferase family 2 protein [Armatimonadota bacterium]
MPAHRDDIRLISVVVPVLNEAESLRQLHEEVSAAAAEGEWPVEIVFVDDGSDDGSWKVIRELAQRDQRVRGVRFRRNFGKAAALAAGFNESRGDVIVTMDADLQDDPAEVAKLLEKIRDGYDAVSGWKRHRQDPWHKVWPSRVFNAMVRWLTGVKLHDVNCGLKAFRSEALKEVRLYGELHRFIPILAHARGFKVTEVTVSHRPRQYGHTKYGARRFVKGFLDLLTVKFLTGFGQRPLHFLGGIGLACFLFGGAGLVYLTMLWLTHHRPIGTRPLLMYSLLLTLLGAQMLAFGFLAELLISHHIGQADACSIAERTPERNA